MTNNVGNVDRYVRAVLGLALIAFAWFYPAVPYSFLGWIGIIPLLTAVFGLCPLYSVLGLNTCRIA